MIKNYFKPAFLILLALNLAAFTKSDSVDYKFDFGSAKSVSGYQKITSDAIYSAEKGYGFDFESKPETISRNAAIGNKPFYFSTKLPEGNYEVKMVFGDAKTASNTTVKAESRRLMLENIETKAGQFVTKTFMVNVKDRKISSGGQVSLKSRELTKLDWDDKLTFEFDVKPALNSIEIKKVTNQTTIF